MSGQTFRKNLDELRQAIAAAELDADTAEAVASDLAMIERQFSKESPSAAIIRTRLANIAELLAGQGASP